MVLGHFWKEKAFKIGLQTKMQTFGPWVQTFPKNNLASLVQTKPKHVYDPEQPEPAYGLCFFLKCLSLYKKCTISSSDSDNSQCSARMHKMFFLCIFLENCT